MNSKRKNYNKQDFGPPNKIPKATKTLDINNTFSESPIVSRRPDNCTRSNPSKASARNTRIRKAKRILKRQATAPIKEDQVSSSQDFLRIQEDIKWSKSYEIPRKRTFAQIARGRKIIGLLDNGNFEGKIPRNQWDWIQASLASVALEVLRENPGPPPSCTDAGWFQGNIKLIACDSDRSALLYKWATAKVGEVYPGAQLEVVDLVDIPSRPWATAWLPETPSDSVDILEMLRTSNPELPIQGWNVIKADKFEREMMLVIFQINHLSIEHISRCDGLLNYGLDEIRMQCYRTPHDALSNLEALAAAVDPPTDDDELETNESHLNEDLSFLSDYDLHSLD
ncbi:uncharacterized protein LOC117790680 [Drosophila innubila]|uniref:uncharacterized protein LOC117790680 n=1 Tax=Drosophila innubila TaxID=198719 RepID=UPI00148DBE07|nr:uncharacterized protein LOC117790680 [Drosophila innubila]